MQSMASPTGHEQGPISAVSAEPLRRSGGSNPVSSLLEQSESRPQSQQAQRDPRFSAGAETGHGERRMSPKAE
jgi:hypothetical protein